MPELPEVETVCRTLQPHLLGRTIRGVEVLEPRLRLPVDERALMGLAGKRIEAVTRIAEYILLSLAGEAAWIFYLCISGEMICVGENLGREKNEQNIDCLND